MSHALTLLFDRDLNEAEWREVTAKASKLPYVKRLHADILTVGDVSSIDVEAIRTVYRQARQDFLDSVNLASCDKEAQDFAQRLSEAIGEISVSEAKHAFDRYLELKHQ